MTIPNSVTSIDWYAFSGCKDLEHVYCFSENPPSVKTGAFKDAYIENATLHVPASSIDAYKAAEEWKGFGKIVALTEKETAIKTLTFDDKKTKNKVYTIDGKPASTLQKGVNIIRMKDGKTKKVLVN